jgi:alpha-L-arabinofuranosidase
MAGAAWPGPAGAATAKSDVVAGVKLSGGPLGIDVAPWTNPATLTALRSQLEAAGVTEIHYGGGTTADEYNWQNDTDISNCKTMSAADYTAACATHNVDALKFSTFSQEARAIGAQSMVTVNYGTGTAAWAAAWVKQATSTSGQAIADYEIGNENYGCWEPNDWIAGFQPNVAADCPMNTNLDAGMQEVATSYANNAATFMAQMKAANQCRGRALVRLRICRRYGGGRQPD